MMNLMGRTAIVTGAARGLGRTYAMKLMEAGTNVVVADRADTGGTMELMYGPAKALAVEVDVADFNSVSAMAEKALSVFGRIDILINNAALYGGLKGGRAEQIDEAEWDRCMAVNVKGVWNCCRAVIPPMKKQGGGSIVNISSLAAIYGLPYSLHYASAKAAVIGMTRSLARELGRDWIRVNAIAPTAVLTEGTKEFFGEKFGKGMDVVRGNQALKRNLETEDLVGTVLYLASDASKFVTGQTIMVDGGTHFL
jgi:3-oxoacyl-[acyl-carrier protein] reductase